MDVFSQHTKKISTGVINQQLRFPSNNYQSILGAVMAITAEHASTLNRWFRGSGYNDHYHNHVYWFLSIIVVHCLQSSITIIIIIEYYVNYHHYLLLQQLQYDKKCMFLYGAVSSPLDRSQRFELHPWQTCSFGHQLHYSGKHSSHAAITREDCSLIFPPLSVARYSFTLLSELGRHGENENGQTSKR